MIPCDLHVHPDYSIDAHSSIGQYCERARQIGLATIGFSTHYDVNPARAEIDPFAIVDGRKVRIDDKVLERYIEDCREARRRFPELKILIGLEVDYFIGVESEIMRLKSEFDFNYLIGSVHCLDNVAISSRREAAAYLRNHSLEAMADQYFGLLLRMAESGLFDTIGHADYYIRNGADFYNDGIYRIFEGQLEKIVQAANRSGTGFEINTSCSRHGYGNIYPALDFLRQAISFGARVNSIGSDAHHHQDLGHKITETMAMLKQNGIDLRPFYESEKA